MLPYFSVGFQGPSEDNKQFRDSLEATIHTMVQRGVIPDREFAYAILQGWPGILTRRRMVMALARGAGTLNEFPAWHAVPKGSAPSIMELTAAVCHERGSTVERICGRDNNDSETSRVRGLCAWVCRRGFGYPLDKIGERMGGRAHSTIIHAINKADTIISRSPAIRASLLTLCDRVDSEAMYRWLESPNGQRILKELGISS